MNLIKSARQLKAKIDERNRLRKVETFFISFPKSGRTWLRLQMGRALSRHFGLDERHMLDEWTMTTASGLKPAHYTHDGSSNTEGRSWKDLATKKPEYARKQVVLLVRDPRDVVVSCYFQASKRKGLFEGDISEFIRSDNYGLRKILTFYQTWEANQSVPRGFELLRYEEMQEDPVSCLRRVLDFIGANAVSHDEVAEAVEFAQFDNMRKMESESRFDTSILQPGDKRDEESFKVRKGKVGGFVDYLSSEDCEWANGLISNMGCSFYSFDGESLSVPSS